MKINSKELKSFLDANKRPSRLVGHLERHIISRPADTSRRTDILHPSEIIKKDWCARYGYYVITGACAPKKDRPGLRLQSIFDEGHTIHAKWQNWIAEMGNLYGVWESPKGLREWGVSKEHLHWNYREVPLEYAPLHIAGHSDGWITGLGDDFLIEIKSIGSGTIRMEQPSLLDGGLESAWRNIRNPFWSHLRQGTVYLYLTHLMAEAGLLPRPAPGSIVFIYELKMDQAYKEFSVDYNPDLISDVIENLELIAEAMKTGIAPPCTQSEKGCKLCALAEKAGIDE